MYIEGNQRYHLKRNKFAEGSQEGPGQKKIHNMDFRTLVIILFEQLNDDTTRHRHTAYSFRSPKDCSSDHRRADADEYRDFLVGGMRIRSAQISSKSSED